ncbi:GNAT family N-acetyltransferase [Aeromicrobium wangtongii]|uniref:GNAT family N-acetyltransferase n=1 Tax=Aeromicrobium wangtongii TaxID=2969247 RepID=UPI0020180229|nr:GNAT family N-acetyltransferase [Aeromicrobium wangtongii]MCL3819735.1 GNAT family N-acetyltransferase [Aeromicrobium wangtongii]
MTTVERLDPRDGEQFAAFHGAYLAAHDDEWDRPYSAQERRAELLDDSSYTVTHGVLARDVSGHVVGSGVVELPLKDNLTLAYIEVAVPPEHRRRGHGTAILRGLEEIAVDAGRTALFAEVRWPADADASARTAFAEARGFRRDLVDAHRVLDLPASLPEAPVRDGYSLRAWRGPCPPEWVDQYAGLLSLLVQEAPSGDYPLENEFFDAERVRRDEQLLVAQGRVMQVAVAVADDGRLAAHTQLVFSESDPDNVYQWDTLVLPEHRGHGLGLSLKILAMRESADLLEGRRYVHTFNAATNGPMIAVNDAMGFRLVGWLGEYVRELEA